MPPSTSTSLHARVPSSSNAISNGRVDMIGTVKSRFNPTNIIEIDDSSDDDPLPDLPHARPAGPSAVAALTANAAPARLRGVPIAAGESLNMHSTASRPQIRSAATTTFNQDPSATENSSDEEAFAGVAEGSLFARPRSPPPAPARSSFMQGIFDAIGSNGHSRSRSDLDATSLNSRAAGNSSLSASSSTSRVVPQSKFKGKGREIQQSQTRARADSSSATDYSSEDAPVVASTSSSSAGPNRNLATRRTSDVASNTNARRGSDASRNPPSSSSSRPAIWRSTYERAGITASGSTSTMPAAKRKESSKSTSTSKTKKRTQELSTSDASSIADQGMSGQSDSDSSSDSSSDITVASVSRNGLSTATAAAAAAGKSSKGTSSSKRTREPEVVVPSTKRTRLGTSGSTGAVASRSTRSRAPSTASTAVAGPSASTSASVKGKGRALRSSVEPTSNSGKKGSTPSSTSATLRKLAKYGSLECIPIESVVDNRSSGKLRSYKDPTTGNDGVDMVSSYNPLQGKKINAIATTSTSSETTKTITKVEIKPTDLSEELECAICSETMVSPVNLGCGHTFCDACVVPWLDEHKDCPQCREKAVGAPVRNYLADKIIKKYLASVYEALESQGKTKEAKAARAERAQTEKDAEARRIKAAQDKTRREAAAEAALEAARNGPAGHRPYWQILQGQPNAFDPAAAEAIQRLYGGGAAPGAVPLAGRAAGRGNRARQMERQAELAAAAQRVRARTAEMRALLDREGADAGNRQDATARRAAQVQAIQADQAAHAAQRAVANNIHHFGNLVQHRDGVVHVDPNNLQAVADQTGLTVAELHRMMFQQ